MKPPFRIRRDTLCAAVSACFLALPVAYAEDGGPLPVPPQQIKAGERLSDWLLRQAPDARAYPLALSWQLPAQRLQQARLKQHLLARLAVAEDLKVAPEVRQRLARMLQALPVTGRMPVRIADPRWLQAHPEQDPVLDYDHSVLLPRRPSSVTVITEDARRCVLPHRPGAEARAYLSACQPDLAQTVDRVWIIQPDGTVQLFNIAEWNAQTQDPPAPGARIWAPGRDSGWTPAFSARFAEFLATQPLESSETDAPSEAESAAGALPRLSPGAPVQEREAARSLPISANDWGLIGVLQTPSARMAETGELRFQFSHVYPYNRGSVLMQPLDWLEAGFRYTDISNRLYGAPGEFSSKQSNKDKNVDVKFRLMKESALLPQLALGFSDLGGTGLFSSEYLVASKRSGNFDWSLGIAWGYLGGSNNVGNPLSSLFGKGFDKRAGSSSVSGGSFNTSSWFHGNAALFGGVQYQTPWENLLLKAEYDGNNYQHEPQDNNRKHDSPINVGLVYRYSPSTDFSLGVERGNTVMFGLSFHGGLQRVSVPKLSDPPMPRIAATRPQHEPDWKATAADLAAQTHWQVEQISRNGGELRVVFNEAEGYYWKERIERVAAVLHRDAPADINRFVLVFVERGLPMTERVILRESWVSDHIRYQAMAERFEAIAAMEPRSAPTGNTVWKSSASPLSIGLAPSFSQTIGGPDGFILFQLGASTPMTLRLSDSTWLSGNANVRLLDNYDKFTYDAPSNLPRVRTDLRRYVQTSTVTLPNLQATHLGRLNEEQFYSIYAGYLESMFAGVGGEWLYRPWHSAMAFGVDINKVQQRDFRQDFSLRDYRVTTGHATVYWDTGWNSTHINLSVGQYLAGDRGATLEASRSFNNGITMGAWATRTNVSAATFGEGSFDKGIYLSVPFDAMLTALSPSVANLAWTPLTRDGGARLARSNTLYGLTSSRDKRLTHLAPPGSPGSSAFDDNAPEWASQRSLFGDLGTSTLDLGAQLRQGQTGTALLTGGGIVLATALLDSPLDQWARNHQGGTWGRLGQLSNAIPLLLAGGTGMLWWGLGGEMASETAWTSIKSAALTVGTETLTRFAVGRSRPESEVGTAHFTSFSKSSARSSFPSVHMGAAFALVTPFAQQYDAPWLYSLAGMTAFGRIQQRQHFASDVTAGALIGYGIGMLLREQQQNKPVVPRIVIGADRNIEASWAF